MENEGRQAYLRDLVDAMDEAGVGALPGRGGGVGTINGHLAELRLPRYLTIL